MEDIEDMIGDGRAELAIARDPIVTVKNISKIVANVEAGSVPGTQKIWIKTYGCSHNVSDSEYMQGVLASYGYHFTESRNDADLWYHILFYIDTKY